MRRAIGRAAALAIVIVGAAACTDSPAEVADVDRDAVTTRVADAGVTLAVHDAACAAADLDDDDLATLGTEDDLPFATADALARSVIDCAGSQVIARSSLGVLSGGASPESIECAADAFDADLVVDLLRGRLTGEDDEEARPRQVELEVAVSLGECLTPAELAALG